MSAFSEAREKMEAQFDRDEDEVAVDLDIDDRRDFDTKALPFVMGWASRTHGITNIKYVGEGYTVTFKKLAHPDARFL